jgi:cytochrome c peroxidase
MGITQFDTPECKSAVQETRVSIQTLIEILSTAYQKEISNAHIGDVLKQLNRSLSFFNKIKSPDEIDFLSCLRDYYVPLSKSFATARANFVEQIIPENNFHPTSAIRFTNPSLFETNAFNTYFYNPRGTDFGFSKDAAELGRTLFFDPIMSDNNKRACASCHQPEHAFTDNAKTSVGFHEGEKVLRNAPTIINVALQRSYFFDMRADNLEGQIGHVLTNVKEMKSNFDSLISKLNSSPEYVEWFRRAFAGTEDTVITKHSIVNAIADYERKLVSLNSKFDKNVRGNERSFSKEEKKGFNIFMNKGRCATCHYLPLFNNMVPPLYTKGEWEIIGTTESPDTLQPKLDPDPGRGGVYGKKLFWNAFKTPTLRNISMTAPYMHNGAFNSLEEVIRFYDVGGGAGMHLDVPNQTLPADSLHLTEKEKKSLIAFLKTLSDTTNLTSAPTRLPAFPNSSSLSNRKVGGEY